MRGRRVRDRGIRRERPNNQRYQHNHIINLQEISSESTSSSEPDQDDLQQIKVQRPNDIVRVNEDEPKELQEEVNWGAANNNYIERRQTPDLEEENYSDQDYAEEEQKVVKRVRARARGRARGHPPRGAPRRGGRRPRRAKARSVPQPVEIPEEDEEEAEQENYSVPSNAGNARKSPPPSPVHAQSSQIHAPPAANPQSPISATNVEAASDPNEDDHLEVCHVIRERNLFKHILRCDKEDLPVFYASHLSKKVWAISKNEDHLSDLQALVWVHQNATRFTICKTSNPTSHFLDNMVCGVSITIEEIKADDSAGRSKEKTVNVRIMRVAVPVDGNPISVNCYKDGKIPKETKAKDLSRIALENKEEPGIKIYQSVKPYYSNGSFVVKFGKLYTKGSVKNLMIQDNENNDKKVFLFLRISGTNFTLRYSEPFDNLTAFATTACIFSSTK